LKIFTEIILIYYIENDNFKTLLNQNFDKFKDLFINELIENKISINNPRNNFDKINGKNESKIYRFNQGIFEILNDDINSLQMIIRKPLFTVEMNVKNDFSKDKIIIKDELKKVKY
jgi:thiamine kinase-like enzyme